MDFSSIADNAISIVEAAAIGSCSAIISVSGIVIGIGLLVEVLKKVCK